jgi:hypothetical protein
MSAMKIVMLVFIYIIFIFNYNFIILLVNFRNSIHGTLLEVISELFGYRYMKIVPRHSLAYASEAYQSKYPKERETVKKLMDKASLVESNSNTKLFEPEMNDQSMDDSIRDQSIADSINEQCVSGDDRDMQD